MFDRMLTLMLDQMVHVIVAHALYAREQLGKNSLDENVLRVMGRVPRHEFVPPEMASYAYADQPLPIGYDKTVSQPFIVAVMTDLLELRPDDRVLEVGTGLGYHAAVLSELAQQVYTVEIVPELAEQAKRKLGPLGYGNVMLRTGNGMYGWPEHAPYDKIVVGAASELIPAALIGQLKAGGRMVVPSGLVDAQKLMVVEKNVEGRIKTREVMPVRFALLETPS